MGGPGLAAFMLRRLLWGLFLLVAASIVTYVIFWIVPANPAGIKPASPMPPPEAAALIEHYLQLDQPIWRQYLTFVWRIVGHGSLGRSYWSNQTVDSVIGSAAPVTASLIVGGAILWLSISIPLGVLSALRPRTLLDRTSTVLVLLGMSAHPVWIGLILSYVVGYRLGLTPIQGYCDFFGHNPVECRGALQWSYHLVLPWLTFMALYAALYLRLVRATVAENLGEDYVRTARAKGAGEGRVIVQHVLRNSLLPIVTIFGMDIGLALGGAIFTETVFGLPGLGYELIHAYNFDDYPVIVGIVMFGAVCVITFNVIVDIVYAFLDPRVRLA